MGDTASYHFQAYVYNNTAGSVGGAVDENVVTLYYGGNTITSAAYTPVDGEAGWYKLTGTVTGVASAVDTGLLVKTNKTVIVDDLSLYNYDDSGTLTSSIFDSEFAGGAAWGTLTYTATTPGSTTVTVKARTSNSASMTGATDFATCNAITSASDISGNNCVTDSHRYIQYQLTVATTDPLVTPTFQDISIAFAAYDTDAPSIALTALSPDPTSDSTPAVSGTAADSASTVSAVQFQMDSTAGSWTACTATDGTFDEASEAFTCAVTSALTDGAHTIYVRSTDSLSNTTSGGSDATDTFTIDSTSPALSLTAISPDPGTDTTPTLTGTATDATSILAAIQFQIDGTSGSWIACSADDGAFDETSESFTCAVTSALSDGEHTIYIRATDNAGHTSSSATDSFTVDTTGPISKDLDYPADGSYINNARPTFRWKAFSDATSGLSSYKLEVTRADSSDTNTENTGFTIDGIEVSRTTTYSTYRYNIGYANFSDSDSANDYLTVVTKSSSDWGSGNNDGKLKQGKYTWKVTATDAVGNTVASSKTFYVDLTNPTLTATVDSLGEVDGYEVVTDLKPKISGSLTDNYAVDKIEFAFYKQSFFFGIETARSLYTLETVNHPDSATTSWSYSFSPSQHLDYGKYQLEMTGYDKSGNTAAKIIINIQILTDSAARFALLKNAENKAEVIEKIRAKTKISLPELEKQAKIRRQTEAANLTKFTQENTRLLARITSMIGEMLMGFWNKTGEFMANLGFQTGAVNDLLGGAVSNLNHRMTDFENSSRDSIAKNWKQRGIAVKKTATALSLAYRSFQEPAAKGANFFYRIRVAFDTSEAIVFDPTPTSISNVTIERLEKDYAVISWDTNHFTKNNKVNYGRDLTYGQEVWGEDYTKHHTITLTGLKPESEYFFEAMSQNKNYAYDAYYRFETTR